MVENKLHQLGEDYLLVDLEFPGASTPFLMSDTMYDLGGSDSKMVPRDQFRALVFLDKSEAMIPLPW